MAGRNRATTVAAANAWAAWPEGNDEPWGSLIAGWIAWSATGGRARPTSDLIAEVIGQLANAARAATTNVQGRSPSTGTRRLFTHQAEVRISSHVSGWKRIACSASLTASSTVESAKTATTAAGAL